MNKEWQLDAIKLFRTGVVSDREISKIVKKPRSTVNDLLRKYRENLEITSADVIVSNKVQEDVEVKCSGIFNIVTDNEKQNGTHLYIPDTQCKTGISLNYLRYIGEYIVRKKPDVLIHGGDHADMESLSSYDKGKKSAEGKRVSRDIEVAIEGMKALLKPLYDLQQKELEMYGEIRYKPRMVLTLGNHEDRITRYVNDTPELEGFLSIDSLKYAEFGWEVIPFLTPIEIGGVFYCHYFQNVMTGKPLSGTAANMLKVLGKSFTMGHRQQLDITTRYLQADGTQQYGLIAGACYEHEEHYKGVQGNHHWRGVVVKHRVKNGSYDPLFVSLDWLKEQYGKD